MAQSEEVMEPTVTVGRENVFADLGFADAEEMLTKAKLAIAIKDVIKHRKLTQAQAAELMGIDQPRVSKLVGGRLSEFSAERLMQYLVHLGLDIEIVIHRTATPNRREGVITVAYV